MVKRLLSKQFPRALVNAWLAYAGIAQDRVVAKLPKKSRQKLIEILTAMRFEVIGVQRQKAMAVDGGIALKEVNGGTLESRLVPGLYFAGEILDLVGPCGGYNLQWAFTSGRFAGMNAVKTTTST
jgi:predicted flavoprotein YhiN